MSGIDGLGGGGPVCGAGGSQGVSPLDFMQSAMQDAASILGVVGGLLGGALQMVKGAKGGKGKGG